MQTADKGLISKIIVFLVSYLSTKHSSFFCKLYRVFDDTAMTNEQILSHLQGEPQDVFYYFQGNIRLWLYQNKLTKWLVAKYVAEQYESRIRFASSCYKNGSCLCCGCKTPAVFFADKGCSVEKLPFCEKSFNLKVCYPPMADKDTWELVQTKP